MIMPPKGHPIWGLMALGVMCTTLCICLDKVYDHGFVLDKDGFTVGITGISGVVMIVARHFFGVNGTKGDSA